jgi:hypothetical protein
LGTEEPAAGLYEVHFSPHLGAEHCRARIGTIPMRLASIVLAGFCVAAPLRAQEEPPRPLPSPTGIMLLDDAHRAQLMFEMFRRDNLPDFNGRPNGQNTSKDREVVGKFVYWYDEKEPPPPAEPAAIKTQRAQLVRLLDSAAKAFPEDNWTNGQLIRYLSEDSRAADEIRVARACRAEPWWCSALAGFAYHDARQFTVADSAYAVSLRQMPQRLRCDWSDASVLLDEYTLRTYHRVTCGSPERAQYEERMWWLAKPLYGLPGMDTRTEYLARMTMVRMLEDAPSVHQFGFDIDERELLLRYGWPRAWSVIGPRRAPQPMLGGRGGMRGGMGDMGGGRGQEPSTIVGHEPAPSYQFLMPGGLSNSPALSDSVDWETGVPPVHARYAPMYARKMGALVHQSAMFRRGDSSYVVLAWDATGTPLAGNARREMALALVRADSLQPVITRKEDAPVQGVMIAKGPWTQLLMSAELTAKGIDTAYRARYGLRPPYAMGARVTLSEMLFFAPLAGEELPNTVEEAAQHAMASIRIRNTQKLGVFFESYGTNPNGEKLKLTFTVVRQEDEPGFMKRRLQAIRPSKDANPVRLTIEDPSLLNSRVTPRAAYLDIKTLKPGEYIVQLEVDVAGQFIVRTERALEVIK